MNQHPQAVVTVRNGTSERLMLSSLEELPPMDIPQRTEPDGFGSTFSKPAPQRSMWQDELDNPWIVRLYAAGVIAGVLLSVVFSWAAS